MQRRFQALLALGLLASGCTGAVDSMGVGGEPGIVFVSPAPADTILRDRLDEHGSRVAEIEVQLEVGGITSVELLIDGKSLSFVTAESRELEISVAAVVSGTVELEARGLDGNDEVIVNATTQLTIADPNLDCHAWLEFFGVAYSVGPTTTGITDPVTATTPIHGLPYRYVSDSSPRDSLVADCSLIRSLAESAGILRSRGVVEVADIGIYNYRCIGGGTPPDCPNGVSQHAYAKAIDIAGYTTDDGAFYSVNDDWVIDGGNEDTCSAPTEGAKDTFLHEIICAQKERGVWNIVLTPNYNAAHRDHFHVDLTDGSDFIGVTAPHIGH